MGAPRRGRPEFTYIHQPDDGHESIYTPAAGALPRAVPAKKS
jgi:hypothetical protein